MKINFIDLREQYLKYKNEIDKQIQEVIDSCQFIMGKKIQELEEKLANYIGTKYALGVSSGTEALLIPLMAYNIKPKDEIITTAFTFFACAEVIALLGAKPIFVDIEEKTYNININLIKDKLNDNTKAIMPVHLYGQSADMTALKKIAEKYNLILIEDGCQAFGSTHNNKKVMSFSNAGATSFFPSKPLGCYGDGGMIFTNDDNLFNVMKAIRVHGDVSRYEHKFIGVNGRLDTIQAAVLLAKFNNFEEEVKLREEKGAYYSEKLKNHVITPYIAEGNNHIYAQYSIRIKNRDKLIKTLNEKGIPTAIHYPKPVYNQVSMEYLDNNPDNFPVSNIVSQEIVSLPFYPFITKEIQDFIINEIIQFVENN